MENGLLGFGPMNYGLLSPTQLATMQAPRQYPTGTYGQSMKEGTPNATPKSGDYYDPYYNLRNYDGLLGNPNFSWLNSFNTDPTNIGIPAQVVPGTSTSGSSGGMGGLLKGWKEKAAAMQDLLDASSPNSVQNQVFDISDPNSWVGETKGKINQWEDSLRNRLFDISDPNSGLGAVASGADSIFDINDKNSGLGTVASGADKIFDINDPKSGPGMIKSFFDLNNDSGPYNELRGVFNLNRYF